MPAGHARQQKGQAPAGYACLHCLDPPTTATPDEDAFRRAAIEAITGQWADAADGRLRRIEADLPR